MSKLKVSAIVVLSLNCSFLVILTVHVTLPGYHKMAVKEETDEQSEQETISQILKTERSFATAAADTEKIQQELYKKCELESATKPAVHLGISRTVPKNGRMQTLEWTADFSANLTCDELKYKDGALTVTTDGYYYVYSTILYRGEGTQELDFGRIVHQVIMKKASETDQSPTVLMQDFQSTPTIRRGREAYTTSSLGATFFLQAYSKVMVVSSLATNIDPSPYGSYFGLFLI